MQQMYDADVSLAEIGATVGLSGERVRQLLRAAGVPPRPPGTSRRSRLAERDRAMAELVARTGDLARAGREFGVSTVHVRRILRRENPLLMRRLPGDGWRVPRGYWTEARIIDAMREWASIHGGPPSVTDWRPASARRLGDHNRAARFHEGLWPHASSVVTRFGGWDHAIRAAGFESRRPRPQSHQRAA
jgi:hypothetical protein